MKTVLRTGILHRQRRPDEFICADLQKLGDDE
jgi:hypothetical protein